MTTQVNQVMTIDRLPLLPTIDDKAIIYVVLNNKDYKCTAEQFKALMLADMPPQPLPEGLVNLTILEETLLPYKNSEGTTLEIAEAIRQVSEAIPQLPEGIVTQTTLGDLVINLDAYVELAQKVTGLEEAGFVTMEALGSMFQEYKPPVPENMVTTQQLTELTQQLEQKDQELTQYKETVHTKEEIGQLFENYVPPEPTGFVKTEDLQQTNQDLEQVKNKLEGVDFNSFVTSEGLNEAIQNIEIPTVPENLPTAQDLENLENSVRGISEDLNLYKQNNFVTQTSMETFVTDSLSQFEPPQAPDLPENLVTTEQLQAVQQQVTQLGGSVQNIAEVQVTQEDIDQAIRDIVFPEPTPQYQLPETVVHQEQLSEQLLPLAEDIGLKLSKPAEAVAGALMVYQNDQVVQQKLQYGRVFYVNPQATDSAEDGSPLNPFKTIQAAINKASSNTVIQLAPGGYTEDLVFTKQNILIQGHGCYDSIVTEIQGSITVGGEGGATSTRFRLKDIQLRNTDVAKPIITFDSSEGRHYFNNVTMEQKTGSTAPIVKFVGANKNWVDFHTCFIGGRIEMGGTPAENASVTFRYNHHAKMELDIQSNFSVNVASATMLKSITHAAGNLVVSYTSGFEGSDGVALNSVANTGMIDLKFVTLRHKTGIFNTINKTGTCPIIMDMCVRDEARDVVNLPS